MNGSRSVVISEAKLEKARKLRDELDEMIETAEILNSRALMRSLQRGERDLRKGKITIVASKKELDDFFRR